jgi:hypothetical protein
VEPEVVGAGSADGAGIRRLCGFIVARNNKSVALCWNEKELEEEFWMATTLLWACPSLCSLTVICPAVRPLDLCHQRIDLQGGRFLLGKFDLLELDLVTHGLAEGPGAACSIQEISLHAYS